MKDFTPLAEGPHRSRNRLQTCKNILPQRSGDPVAFSQAMLAGKFGFMCDYVRDENFDTVWSSVYALNDLSVYRAEGNPARAHFYEDTRLRRVLK